MTKTQYLIEIVTISAKKISDSIPIIVGGLIFPPTICVMVCSV
jgi:hypothetical protein